MIKIVRTIECPKWTKQQIGEMYPGYRILGDSSYGWFHAVEETKCVFVNYGWKELVKDVTKHLKGNGIAIPADLNLAMMAEYCRLTNSSACADEDPNASKKQTLYEQAARFLRVVVDAVASGDPLVSQEEAERRAAICAVCPLNQNVDVGCSGCGSKNALATAANYVMGKSTPLDDKLFICQNCGCALKLKVFVRKDSQDFPDLRKGWFTGCWMAEP